MTEAHVTYLSHRDLAVDLNNAGCALLERRELLGGAMNVLRDGLDALSRPPVPVDASTFAFASADPRGDAKLEEYVSYRAEVWGRAQEHLDTASVLESVAAKENKTQQTQPPKRDDNALVYAEPLRLEPLEDNSQDSHGDLSLEETSAVVLFNLALAHHLVGERTGCAAYVDRAVQFYKMTETMVLKAIRQSSSSGDDNSSASQYLGTIVKGVLNNMGQICLSWRGDPLLGREYFAKLRALLTQRADSGSGRGGAVSLLQEGAGSMDAFRFNVFVVGGVNAASAA